VDACCEGRSELGSIHHRLEEREADTIVTWTSAATRKEEASPSSLRRSRAPCCTLFRQCTRSNLSNSILQQLSHSSATIPFEAKLNRASFSCAGGSSLHSLLHARGARVLDAVGMLPFLAAVAGDEGLSKEQVVSARTEGGGKGEKARLTSSPSQPRSQQTSCNVTSWVSFLETYVAGRETGTHLSNAILLPLLLSERLQLAHSNLLPLLPLGLVQVDLERLFEDLLVNAAGGVRLLGAEELLGNGDGERRQA